MATTTALLAVVWGGVTVATPGSAAEVRVDVDAKQAAAVFERFKTLDGAWTGVSTNDWEEEVTYRKIAGDSVVMSTSFDAHPGETMATMYYLDGDTMRLTHYCVSGTQPQLVATKVENEGRKVTFEWVGGGNLPTRDAGHMDSVVYEFVDDDHFVSRWTWYQNGEERWLEEIRLTRLR